MMITDIMINDQYFDYLYVHALCFINDYLNLIFLMILMLMHYVFPRLTFIIAVTSFCNAH